MGSIAGGQGQLYGWMWAVYNEVRQGGNPHACIYTLACELNSFADLLGCAARLLVRAFARLLVHAFVHLLIFAFADSLISLIFYRFLMSSFALLLCKLLHT